MRNTFGTAVIVFVTLSATTLSNCGPASTPATATSSQPAKDLTLDLGEKVTLKLALIPAGKFLMGSPVTEKGRKPDEIQHEVTISKPFYMGITHVTVDQFAAFANDSGYMTEAEKDGKSVGLEIKDGKLPGNFNMVEGCSWRNPTFEQKGDYPVVEISWNDATAFCDWISKKSGKSVTLPTEAQWEYACRAGTTTAYPWGDNPEDGKGWANCADQSLKAKLYNVPDVTYFSWDDGFVFTSPVASFKPNAFGLYDMIGNASQWCQDRYGDYGKGPATDPTGPASDDPKGPPNASLRVQRGGSGSMNPAGSRSAHRSRYLREYHFTLNGFRVAVAAGIN